jgi:G3E family GTPase
MRLLVIAGFLGSGKTTILLDMARRLTDDGFSLAIVENEIGEIGVDGEVVRRHGLPVREIFGGCICCTLQVGLVETLRDIAAEFAPDYAVVEPTGLAAPGDVVATVRQLMPALESITTVTLVDAERWEMLWEVVEPLVTAQVEAADVVVVNKADAAGQEATAAAREAARRLNPKATVLVTDASSGAGLDALYAAVRP